ncbi:aspartate aminotransferase family protein [Microbaculum marinisediminis]|uniref:Aspartate aminotransferase family protein n=1 Tax=Microbaculum marinisediminis TaxID=2931392 RepID=A0AAW5R518_9HYPH|nr:aspartate aminotransferase family protein [Microbaculum sp. A6E488]MCT8973786.1 aspartate aminotransferase family protein [Microbaculum sp. A6E488]
MSSTPHPDLRNDPVPATATLKALDLAHHLHPFTDHGELRQEGGARVIASAQGCHLTDTDGQRLLDGMGGLWCVNIGYGRRELAEVAARQMNELPYYNSFFKTTMPETVLLAEELAALTPEGLNRVFFSNSGSEANDTNIRIARSYWQKRGEPQRTVIVSRKLAYHGSTIAAASLTGLESMHDIPGVPIPDIVHAPAPFWWANGGDLSADEFGIEAARGLEETIRAVGPERVAAFIGEPVQGAGGVIVPPATYWAEVQRICRKYGILLIVDEVICGFGRTGRWFGSQTFDIAPDIMTIAKGMSSGYLPISASVVHDAVAEVVFDAPGRFPHGYTYSGHPVAAAVARENIAIMKREGIVDYVGDDIGPYFQERLATLLDHPLVGEVRGVGLMAAVELTRDKTGRAPVEPVGSMATPVRNACFENGLVTRAVRDCLVFSPPLVITRAEVDELVAILRRSIDQAL